MSDTEFNTKAQFIKAVREDSATLDGVEYFTEGEGSATTYYARNENGDEEQVTKSGIEDVWEAIHEDGNANADEEEEDDGSEEVHLGTFYYASNWDEDIDREVLEELLDEVGWYIDGEVESGGYRIKTKR